MRPKLPLHISQRGFGLLGLGLVSSLFMGSSPGNPAYTDIVSCGADNSLLASMSIAGPLSKISGGPSVGFKADASV
jgi:hypothetical protein